MTTNDIPQFPHFTTLDLTHKSILQQIANRFASYSDFNFISLFSWDTEGSTMLSLLNENLVIRFSDYLSNDKFYSFIGTNKIDDTVKSLIDYAREQGDATELKLIPQEVAQLVKADTFEVTEDQDNHDYILSVKDLEEFKTNNYRGKKNLLNRFEKEHSHTATQREMDLDDPTTKKAVRRLLSDWQESQQRTDEETHNEFVAINRSLNHARTIGLRAFGVYVENKLVAFTLFEILPKRVAVIHFDKADVRYKGIFEHLKHNFAKHLTTLDVEAINYEQDLGIEGLRSSKLSWHPVGYLKKYTIKIR